jgi:hypothetical protein
MSPDADLSGRSRQGKPAGELRGLPKADPAAATPGMIADYKLLRHHCRVYAK